MSYQLSQRSDTRVEKYIIKRLKILRGYGMFRRYIKNESGNIAITSAVAMLTLLTAVGTAVDISNAMSLKSSLQDASDTATLAAVSIDTDDADVSAENGLKVFNSNQDQSQLENTEYGVTFTDTRATGTASADYPLFFAGVLPRAKISINVKTVVATGSVQGGLCIKALSVTADPALRLNSGAQITGPECEIDVHSMANPALVINSGVKLDVARTCIAGRNIDNKLGPSDNIRTTCDVSIDPYANQYPVPDSDICDFTTDVLNDAIVNLEEGVYCGAFNFGPSIEKVNFGPGLYVIKDGTWTVDGGEWEGEGVTFYFADTSAIQFNSGVEARLTPPETGPYANVFITEAPNLPPSNLVINDSEGFDFEGVIYLPSRQLILNSGATLRSRSINLVADTIIINDAVLNLKPFEGAVSTKTSQAYIAE